MKLRGIRLSLLELPLKSPCPPAFGNVTRFDTIPVEARDDGGRSGGAGRGNP